MNASCESASWQALGDECCVVHDIVQPEENLAIDGMMNRRHFVALIPVSRAFDPEEARINAFEEYVAKRVESQRERAIVEDHARKPPKPKKPLPPPPVAEQELDSDLLWELYRVMDKICDSKALQMRINLVGLVDLVRNSEFGFTFYHFEQAAAYFEATGETRLARYALRRSLAPRKAYEKSRELYLKAISATASDAAHLMA
jgi:hypothetical protein